MRRFIASFLMLACLTAAVAAPGRAASDKQLQNLKGTVTYGSSGSEHAVAAHASAVVQDNDTAATGENSLGGIVLPDSSRVLMGSNSSVHLISFEQTDIAHAKFFVQGKVRFSVQHPKGAKADYTFQTPTAQIAVRGTEGDISSTPNSLQINVYSLSDPNLPVNVVLSNGQVFVLHAGQSLILNFGAAAASAASGAVQSSMGTVSSSTYAPFSEFGAPVNAAALGIAPAVAAHLALLPLISAIVIDTALITVTSHTTTSTVAGPNNTTVPVHVTISFPVIRFP
jgi:hypothetical protein